MNSFISYFSCLLFPEWRPIDSRVEHVPFVCSLVEMTNPSILVDLGVGVGTIYCAMCQAVRETGVSCRSYGVYDGTKPQNGPSEAWEILTDHHDSRYGDFSQLIRDDSARVAERFLNDSVDLLRLDGIRPVATVRRDFETWLAKMSRRGVIIIGGINLREPAYETWRFWAEIGSRYPSFEFLHDQGLGILSVGPDVSEPLQLFLEAGKRDPAKIRLLHERLGRSLRCRMDRDLATARIANLQQELAEKEGLEEMTTTAHKRLSELSAKLAQSETHVGNAQSYAAELKQRLDKQAEDFKQRLEEQAEDFRRRLEEAQNRVADLTARLSADELEQEEFRRSLSWRLAMRLSKIAKRVAPSGSRRDRFARNVLNGIRSVRSPRR